MLKKEIDKKQYRYYSYFIESIDSYIYDDDIKPLNILMSNLQLLYHRYRNAMFEDEKDYTTFLKAFILKDKHELNNVKNIFISKMNLLNDNILTN